MKTSLVAIHYIGTALAETVRALSRDVPSFGSGAGATAGKTLAKDLALLEQAWSPMAIRNLLSDLLRSARAIEKSFATLVVPPNQRIDRAIKVSKEMSTDLIKRLGKELGAQAPGAGGYKRVVCLGYKVKVSGPLYTGKTSDRADMKDKCDDMIKAIRAARDLADRDGRNYNSDPGILKVFCAPEFFFRGASGAYSHDVVHGTSAQHGEDGKRQHTAHRGIVDIMKEEISKPAYKDWLFVLGTAIAATSESQTACTHPGCKGPIRYDRELGKNTTRPVCTKDPSHKVDSKIVGAFVENVAFVIKEAEVYTVTKELVSDLDFKSVAANVGVTDRNAWVSKVSVQIDDSKSKTELDVMRHKRNKYYKSATDVRTKFKDERMGGCVFNIDGVTFGLEVCLDHAASVGSISKGRLNHAANIQVQLIPSAGMSIGSLRTVPGGIVFNVDGETPHVKVVAGATPEVRLSQDREWEFTGATWTALKDIGTDIDALSKLGKGTAWKVDPPTPIGPAGRGSVLLFGPYDIPAA